MIYTLGPEGTFSDKAASLLCQRIGAGGATSFLPSIHGVFDRVLREEDSIGVVPIENAVAGTVHATQDLLIRHAVQIEHEVQIPIAFKLLVRGDTRHVRRVFVQPVAERQCVDALGEYVPAATVVFTDSNTDSAVRFFAAGGETAAVVPADYRQTAEPEVKAIPLPTAPHNATRFIGIRRASPDPQPDFGRQKMSLLVIPRTNRAGLLHDILGSFKRHDMNLTRIESRPAAGRWEYVFFLDASISPATPRAWRELEGGDWHVRLLGCYSVLRGE